MTEEWRCIPGFASEYEVSSLGLVQNRKHAVDTGLQAKGEMVSKKLNDADVLAIRRALVQGESQRSVARRFGIIQQTVSHIARRSTWRHI